MPRFVSFPLVGCTIVREFLCPVKTILMGKHRMGFRVFSGSQGCQRQKLNVRKSRGHCQGRQRESRLSLSPTGGFGKDHISTEDVVVVTAASTEGPSCIPKSGKGFGKLGSSSLGVDFTNY